MRYQNEFTGITFYAPFVVCLILTGIHCYLGIHIVSRGVIFVDLALAQVAALGSTIALLAGYELGSTETYLISLWFYIFRSCSNLHLDGFAMNPSHRKQSLELYMQLVPQLRFLFLIRLHMALKR